MIRDLMRAACSLFFMVVMPAAHAWDGAVTGVVSGIDLVVDSGNFDMRVYLSGSPLMCTGGPAWAYINYSLDQNYSAVVAALMMAKTTGGNVMIYTIKDTYNYCHIGYVRLL